MKNNNHFSTAIAIIKDALLKPNKTKKKSWITVEIFQMVEERRKIKHDSVRCNEINKIITRKIRETEVRDICTEIGNLQAKHDSFNVHEKVNGSCRGHADVGK